MTPKDARVVTPYMRVSFGGKTYKVQVQPGEDGAKAFEREIRRLLNLPEDQEFDVIFHCKAPGTGDKLQLQGLTAFDAAVHCASLSSGKQPKSPAQEAGSRENATILSKMASLLTKLRLGGPQTSPRSASPLDRRTLPLEGASPVRPSPNVCPPCFPL